MRPGAETNRVRLERLGVEFIHGDLRSASDIEGLAGLRLGDRRGGESKRAGRTCLAQGAAGGYLITTWQRSATYSNTAGSTRPGCCCSAAAAFTRFLRSLHIPLRVRDEAFVVDATAPLPAGLSADGIGVDFSTAAPVSLYGATKLASEIMALEYGAAFDFPVWITRCGVLAGAGQFGTPAQGIFAFWVNAHLRRRPLRYIGFNGKGYQARDAFHPQDLAALLVAQIRTARSDGQRVYTAGGGPANTMSLAQLTAWCDERFGRHVPAVDLARAHV